MATRLGSDARVGGHTPAAPTARHHRRSRRPGGLQQRGLQAQVDAVRAAHSDARLTVWAEDEHRLGVLPIVRRVGARRGQRPTAWVRRHSPWRSGYAFVRPTTGQRWWGLVPTVTTEAMTQVLAAFARDEGIDARHRAVLGLDGAGWHPAKRLVVPDGVDLVCLPSASPELQPVERVWSLVDEPVANRTCTDLTELSELLVTRCQTLRAAKRQIKAHTGFPWWAVERRPRNHQ